MSRKGIIIPLMLILFIAVPILVICGRVGKEDNLLSPNLEIGQQETALQGESQETAVPWDGVSDFKSGVLYFIAPEQVDKFYAKRPEMAELMRYGKEKRKSGNMSMDNDTSGDTKLASGGCNAYASCSCGTGGGGTAHASAGPELANGYAEAWVHTYQGGHYKREEYHAGNPAVSVYVSKAGRLCEAGARGVVNGYCNEEMTWHC